jgi:hypothetical protein
MEYFYEDFELLLEYWRQQQAAGFPDAAANTDLAAVFAAADADAAASLDAAKEAYKEATQQEMLQKERRQREQQRQQDSWKLPYQGRKSYSDADTESEEEYEAEWARGRLATAAAKHAAAGRAEAAAATAAAARCAQPLDFLQSLGNIGADMGDDAPTIADYDVLRPWILDVVRSRKQRALRQGLRKEDIPPITIEWTGNELVSETLASTVSDACNLCVIIIIMLPIKP